MAEPVDSTQIPPPEEHQPKSESWMKVGVVAAISALAGGLAAAWYYRKTLTRLQEAEETPIADAPSAPDEEEL